MLTLLPSSLAGCPRCEGFMASQHLRDFEFDGIWHQAIRCVNCGFITDPVIHFHQQQIKSFKPKRFRLRYCAPGSLSDLGDQERKSG
jgi:hypothetical protein